MIYIVTGDGPRCGSVMMMRSLEAGGLPLAYDPRCDVAAEKQARHEYHPSPEGLYELSLEEMMGAGFPDPSKYDGRGIKMFPPPWSPLTQIVGGEYKVLWLSRPATARWRSFQAFHTRRALNMTRTSDMPNDFGPRLRDMATASAACVLHNRADMDSIKVQYELVLEEPLKVFQLLASKGWPIDPDASAKIPDPTRKRF